MTSLSYSPSKVTDAVTAFYEFARRKEATLQSEREQAGSQKFNLLSDYADDEHTLPLENFDLVVGTKKILTPKKIAEPVQVPLPHRFLGKSSADSTPFSVCLLARNLKSAGQNEGKSIEFYNKRVVEATVNEETALAALLAEEEKEKKTKKNKKNSNEIDLKELAKIKVDRVVTFSQLRTEFKPFQSRRKLISEHDIFFADTALTTADNGVLLPKILGKNFYNSTKTVPQPVNLINPASIKSEKKDKAVELAIRNKADESTAKKLKTLKNEKDDFKLDLDVPDLSSNFSLKALLTDIYKRLNGTHFMLTPASQISVRVGSTALSVPEMVENIEATIDYVKDNTIPSKWDGIRGIYLKTSTGPSLPLFISSKPYEDNEDVAEESEDEDEESKKKVSTAQVIHRRKAEQTVLADSKIEQLLSEVLTEEQFKQLKSSKKSKPTTKKVAEEQKESAKPAKDLKRKLKDEDGDEEMADVEEKTAKSPAKPKATAKKAKSASKPVETPKKQKKSSISGTPTSQKKTKTSEAANGKKKVSKK